jgi:hypothetical protein
VILYYIFKHKGSLLQLTQHLISIFTIKRILLFLSPIIWHVNLQFQSSLELDVFLDVPFEGLNFTYRKGLALRPHKV